MDRQRDAILFLEVLVAGNVLVGTCHRRELLEKSAFTAATSLAQAVKGTGLVSTVYNPHLSSTQPIGNSTVFTAFLWLQGTSRAKLVQGKQRLRFHGEPFAIIHIPHAQDESAPGRPSLLTLQVSSCLVPYWQE